MNWLRSALALGFVLTTAGCHVPDYSPLYAEGEIAIFDDLFAISTSNGNHVVAVGFFGAAYVSTDAGETWSLHQTGTQKSLYDVSMADENRGWAVGQRGLILRTEDGGRSWAKQSNVKEAQGSQLFAVHAIDANTAWTVGEWGTRLFTDDGGTTWQDRSLTIGETHPRFVWLAPAEQEAVRGGEKVFEDVGLNDVFCLAPPSQRCWIVGEFGYVFFSENLGLSWEKAEIIGEISMDPVRIPYNETDIGDDDGPRLTAFAKEIADLNHLNIDVEPVALAREIKKFGSEDDPFELFEILDARVLAVREVLEEAGILSDRIRTRNGPPWDFEDFLEDDPTFLRRFLDGRRSEFAGIRVRVAQNPYLFKIRFHGEDSGLISGLGGVILKSQDGGRTWAYRETDRTQALFSVAASADRALSVGEKGLVQMSTDGGETWNQPDRGFPEFFTFLRNVVFAPDGRTGFIVGQAGMVLRTTDAGANWEQVLPPKERRLAKN
ncbi:MAG: hypothetical protein JRH10_17635 [Deltaproteobacteria bacterium]|nr:hypothetical protein [Deltaproteobacteria bacterium]MBW2444983.1 hypothetical protein [Deltaproteobacteria bacterium]